MQKMIQVKAGSPVPLPLKVASAVLNAIEPMANRSGRTVGMTEMYASGRKWTITPIVERRVVHVRVEPVETAPTNAMRNWREQLGLAEMRALPVPGEIDDPIRKEALEAQRIAASEEVVRLKGIIEAAERMDAALGEESAMIEFDASQYEDSWTFFESDKAAASTAKAKLETAREKGSKPEPKAKKEK